jgi:iron complex outermembrane receptor protein
MVVLKKLLVILLLHAAFGTLCSQTCTLTLRGRIVDANSGKSLDFALLSVKGTGISAVAGERGKFVLKNICSGTVTIECSHIGCQPGVYTMVLNRDTAVIFSMNHTEKELEEIVVEQHAKDKQVVMNVEKLEGRQLDQVRGLSLGETLKKITGVTTLNTGSTISKPVIHGLHSNRVLILNNGIRMEGQQWGNEHAPEIDPYTANSFTVVKGADAVRYGSDAIGGVILVEPKAMRAKPGIGGEFDYAFFSNNLEHNISAMLEGNHKKLPALSWRVQGTYRRGGNSKTPGYWLKNTGLQEGDFSAALAWKKERYGLELFYSRFYSTIGIYYGSHIGNAEDLNNIIAGLKPPPEASFTYTIANPRQEIVHDLLKVRAYIATGKSGELGITFARQFNLRREYDSHRAYNDSLALLKLPGAEFGIQTYTLDAIWEHKRIKNFSGMVGISLLTQTNNQKYSSIIPNFWNFNGGIFWIERWQFKKLEVEAGIRFDYRWQQAYLKTEKPQFRYAVPSGNIGAEYHFTGRIKWNINLGTAWRAPQMVELFANGVHHGAATFEIGNRKLEAEQSFNITSAFDARLSWVTFNISFYQNFINHFIYLKPGLEPEQTIRGVFPTFKYEAANVSLTGADIDITFHPYKGLEIWSKTALLRPYNRTDKEWLISMPSQRFENGIRYTLKDFRHIAGTYFGAGILAVLKQALAPANQDYAAPPAGYWLLNLEAGFDVKTRHQPIGINLTVNNVLNKTYRDYLNRFRYFADERGVNVALRLKVPVNILFH